MNEKQVINYLSAKLERYEEALRFISGEGTTVYADTLEEARESALTALDDEASEHTP